MDSLVLHAYHVLALLPSALPSADQIDPHAGNFPVQPYDVLMLVILVLATLLGFWKGMAWQVASIASLVLSCLVAVKGSEVFVPDLSPPNAAWNRFLAMLVLFLLTSLAVWIVFRVVRGIIDRLQLKEFDRQIGGLLGLVKGVLLCLVITFFAVTLSQGTRQIVLQSRSGYYIAAAIRRAEPVLPAEVREVLGTYIDQLQEGLDPTKNPPPAEPPEPQTPASEPVPGGWTFDGPGSPGSGTKNAVFLGV